MDLSKPQFRASSSSSSNHSCTYDVFLSFRGPDTRNYFTSHLHSNLVNKGFETFIDDGLPKGEDISQKLLEVIERSKISVVVFSANYAFSKWCLNELVKIIECKESKHQIVCPIFYKVEPSEIRYQTGQVGDGIAHLSKYEENLKKVESWKAALRKAADLSGWLISDGGNEANIIGEIVKDISTNITKSTLLHVATHPVGIESRVEDILKLLNVGQADPHMVGIWGIGGIGKSTLAKAVYNSISNKFEHSCFLANVREESSSSGGLVKLQNNFLKNIERDPPNVENVAKGITLLKQKLSQKKVLLVIDDVDCLGQLEALAAESGWFGPGSKIIITTRDTNCVSPDSTYEVKELNHEDASKLFNCYAFKGDIYPDGFFELATEVIHYAKGIPLVLEVLGSDLCSKKDKDVWKAALEYYRRCPNKEIQKILQRSYDGLHDQIQEVFLHIACFFKGNAKSYVIDVLQSCDLNPKYALEVLVEKALIKIEEDDWIWMHDLIEDMGKEIVRQESPEIGKRSRLWLHEDVSEVLEENKGTDKIKAIVLGRGVWNSQKIQLDGGSFTNLKNLKIFKVDYEMLSGESVDYLPNQLRVLDWSGCSLRSLPTNFNPRKLGMLRMSGPCTTPLGMKLKEMRHLKSIKLRFSNGLTRIPDLSGLPCLKELELSYCEDLDEVDPSVGRLNKLVHLRLSDCKKLQMFPKVINLKSLETLDLSGCPKLKFFPEIEGDMKSLAILDLSGTAIKELPCSVGNLTGLKSLNLESCYNLTNVPSSIFYGLQCLEDLDLSECVNLVTFPTKSESVPPPPVFSINLTSRLQVNLNGCRWGLEEISEFPQEIDGLSVCGCRSLKTISKLSKILEGKDPKMFSQLDLTCCYTLCDNLARGVISGVDKRLFHLANKRTGGLIEELMEEEVKLTALLTLFFSCAKSEEFQVTFPAHAPLPNWFTCRQDVNGKVINKEHEFCIEIPQNSNWDNKGLALCIQSYSDEGFFPPELTHFVYINGIKFHENLMSPDEEVWVHYIPIVTVKKRLSESGISSPDMFRVMFRLEENFISRPFGASWGVHLIEDLEGEGQ
ncbi:disease resistance protein RUN1-like [Rosa rugosa]|uniref:disease resistance protein RUN1-like n=1 Tax=Rosa rugosa TaxID=74645 RepID=UPI002B407DF2|nr:disease resistance protein RUN1-like [Rosa rugosa]